MSVSRLTNSSPASTSTVPDVAKRVVFVSGGVTAQTKDFLDTVTNLRVDKPFSVNKLRGAVDEMLARLTPRENPVNDARQN